MRTGKLRSAAVIISRGLPGISRSLFVLKPGCHGRFTVSSCLGLRGDDAMLAACVAAAGMDNERNSDVR